MKNNFELLNLPVSFEIDYASLQNNFFALQKRYHPDQFQGQARDLAFKMSTMINDAKQILENPARRAAYCCQLLGIDLNQDSVKASKDLIIRQFEWLETLNDKNIKNNENIKDNENINIHINQKIHDEWQTTLVKYSIQFQELFAILFSELNLNKNSEKNVENSEKNINSSSIDQKKLSIQILAQNIILCFNFSKNLL